MAAATKTFDYEVIGAGGKKAKGKIEASSESAAAQALRQQGAVPIALAESGQGLQKELRIPGTGNKVKLKELAVFARQFAAMNSSGLSLLRALAILEEQTERPALKSAVKQARTDIEAGSSLSAAFGKHPKIFPALMVAMIRAGETGGFLDDALDRIAFNLEKDAKLRAKIKSALTYPKIVLGFSAVLLAGVLIFIVPVFEKMFADLGGNLPLPTRIIVGASHNVWWFGPLLLLLVGGFSFWLKRRLRESPEARLKFDAFKLRIPVFGNLNKKVAISRFSRNLGTLLNVGVPVMQALDIVGATTGNAVIELAAKDVQEAVRQGSPMSAPLTKHEIFPPMVTHMMEVGEETGQISAMLDKVADFYDHEVDTATEALTAAIEPIMVMVMGGIVGTMVVCLYLPMFSIYQHVQGS